MNSGDTNIIYCTSEEIKDTFEFSLDGSCTEGGKYYYFQQMRSEFRSSFTECGQNDPMTFNMLIRTAGEDYLTIDLQLANLYSFKFDNKNETLLNYISGYAEPFSVGNLSIQGKEYENVFAIPISIRQSYLDIACYDTIYYNKDGFLKFISSKYGYRLERLP